MSGTSGISAFPEGDNLFKWLATVSGAQGTAYEGLTFKLSLKFPAGYPYSAPTVTFESKCFHPNVDEAGNICLDILKVMVLPLLCFVCKDVRITTMMSTITNMVGQVVCGLQRSDGAPLHSEPARRAEPSQSAELICGDPLVQQGGVQEGGS